MNKLLLLFLSLLIISCNKDQRATNDFGFGKRSNKEELSEYIETEQMQSPVATQSVSSPPPPEIVEEEQSKIIKKGNMRFEVSELEESKRKVDSIIKGCHGYFESEVLVSHGNRKNYALRIRVPNAKFDSLVFTLENGLGELKSKSIDVSDVTEEYRDLNIRLENNLAYLAQYKEILKKARTIKEILEVQEKIRRIEEEIDSKKGRIKYLDNKVSLSTLHVEISELMKNGISNKPSLTRRIGNAFNNGVEMFVNFVIGLIHIWPFILLGTLLLFGRKPIIQYLRRLITKKK